MVWTDKQWIDYTVDKKVKTYVLKKEKDLVGYYELISHTEQNEIEIAYLGVLRRISESKVRIISFNVSNTEFFFIKS